jgi:hypothetical protein
MVPDNQLKKLGKITQLSQIGTGPEGGKLSIPIALTQRTQR